MWNSMSELQKILRNKGLSSIGRGDLHPYESYTNNLAQNRSVKNTCHKLASLSSG